jgi:hypothetical protein
LVDRQRADVIYGGASSRHVAIAEALDGKTLDWMEPVTEEEYLSGPA